MRAIVRLPPHNPAPLFAHCCPPPSTHPHPLFQVPSACLLCRPFPRSLESQPLSSPPHPLSLFPHPTPACHVSLYRLHQRSSPMVSSPDGVISRISRSCPNNQLTPARNISEHCCSVKLLALHMPDTLQVSTPTCLFLKHHAPPQRHAPHARNTQLTATTRACFPLPISVSSHLLSISWSPTPLTSFGLNLDVKQAY